MADSKPKREQVRDLVRQVLAGLPSETGQPSAPAPDIKPQHVLVNSLADKAGKDWDRDESAKNLITESDLTGLERGSRVRVSETARFTPLAHDIISDKGLVLIKKSSREPVVIAKTVAVGCDHGGFEFKEKLKTFLDSKGIKVRDFGTESKEAVDYPDFAHAVARAVGEGSVEVGVIIDGAGIGSAMTANKVPNVKAAACYNTALAKNSREHNGANVLALGAGQNTFPEICEIVMAFLSSEISEERHKKRVRKIEAVEREYKR
jgi:ribose 5-phosphate isomerase B